MSVPAALAGAFAALFLAAAALCTVSLWRRRGRRGRHEGPAAAAEANHVVMALGMAAMVLPVTAAAVPPLAGVGVFAVLGAAWTVRLVALRAEGRALGSPVGGDRCAAHPTHLLLSNAAMVVMYAAMIPGRGATAGHAGHAGHAASSPLALSAVGAALAVYLLVHAAVTVAVLARSPAAVAATAGAGGSGGPVGRVVDAPVVQLGCQAATAAGMALMLLVP